MFRAIVGLIKGLVIGGGAAYALWALKLANVDLAAYVACAAVGGLVGLVCGQAPWKRSTNWTTIIKVVFGAFVGAGLCLVGLKFIPQVTFASFQGVDLTTNSGSFLAAVVGILYGTFVEIDDGVADDPPKKKLPAPEKPA